MKMNSKVYDVLKWVALVLLPGAATLYFALSNIWGLPYVEQIAGTVTAIETFLGVLLGISSAGYYKNSAEKTVVATESNDNKTIEGDIIEHKNELSE